MVEILNVEGLCKTYKLEEIGKEIVALDNVSFKLDKGGAGDNREEWRRKDDLASHASWL